MSKGEAQHIIYALNEIRGFIKEVQPLVDYADGVLDAAITSEEILSACLFSSEVNEDLIAKDPVLPIDGTACLDD